MREVRRIGDAKEEKYLVFYARNGRLDQATRPSENFSQEKFCEAVLNFSSSTLIGTVKEGVLCKEPGG